MRRLLTWLVVSLGVAALLRRLRRSNSPPAVAAQPVAEPVAEPPAAEDDPADELRRKLAESRAEDEPAASAPPVTVEERRAEVHGQGRSALEEMRETDES